MASNVVNTIPFLRTTRQFPEKPDELRIELDKAYLDTAAAVNVRTIGIFPINRPAITGEGFFFTTQKQQTLRQVYPLTFVGGVPQPITHGINLKQIDRFTSTY